MSLSSGIVINHWGAESSQQDLLIVDSAVSPPFVTAGRLGLHPIESVLATIEVKSRLTSEAVANAVAGGCSVKRAVAPVPQPMTRVEQYGQVLYKEAPPGTEGDVSMKPFSAIVGLRGDARAETLFGAFVDANRALPPVDRTNALLVLDSFVTAWSPRDDGKVLQNYPHDARTACRLDLGEDSFLYFYAFLFDALQNYHPPAINLRGYLESADMASDAGVAEIVSFTGEENDSR